jgi:hypothetical protein
MACFANSMTRYCQVGLGPSALTQLRNQPLDKCHSEIDTRSLRTPSKNISCNGTLLRMQKAPVSSTRAFREISCCGEA